MLKGAGCQSNLNLNEIQSRREYLTQSVLQARQIRVRDSLGVEREQTVYAPDAKTVGLLK